MIDGVKVCFYKDCCWQMDMISLLTNSRDMLEYITNCIRDI